MSKNFVPFLIVLVIILIGGFGILFMLTQSNVNSDKLNITEQSEPTGIAIPTAQNSPVQPTPTVTQKPLSTDTLPSGLVIEEIVLGEGDEVKSEDTIVIHYTGSFTNGQKFDSSLDKNQPFETQIGVGQVIKGWDEGIIGMKVGGKRRLIIPPALAYGQQGIPGSIPPSSTLIFELELLEIK